MPDTLAQLLDELETSAKLSEAHIGDEFRKLKEHALGSDADSDAMRINHEVLAFAFDEHNLDDDPGVDVFVPMMTGTRDDGTPWAWPSDSEVTDDAVQYWAERAISARHPIMRARYAGLVWQFGPKHGYKRSRELALANIEACFEAARDDRHQFETQALGLLLRAVRFAAQTRDDQSIRAAVQEIRDFELKHGDDARPGLWGAAFDAVTRNKRAASAVGEDVVSEVVADLEIRLDRMIQAGAGLGEHAAERLANYYRSVGRHEDEHRVVRAYAASRVAWIEATGAQGLLASSWLEEIYQLFLSHNMGADAKAVLPLLRKHHKRVPAEIRSVQHKVSFTQDQIEEIIAPLVAQDIANTVCRIAVYFVPKMQEIRKGAAEVARGSIMMSIIGGQRVDHEGRPIGRIAAGEAGDVSGYWHMNMLVGGIPLEAAIERLFAKPHADEEVIHLVCSSPLVGDAARPLVSCAIAAFRRSDYIAFIHVAIPLIESAIRSLVETQGGRVYQTETTASGGKRMRTLSELLSDEHAVNSAPEDLLEYFRRLLASDEGWNLRNNVCHGLCHPDTFNATVANRVLHALLLLTVFSVTDDHGPGDDGK